MTAKMYRSTYRGEPCFAVTINGRTKHFRYSHNAAQYLLQGLSK